MHGQQDVAAGSWSRGETGEAGRVPAAGRSSGMRIARRADATTELGPAGRVPRREVRYLSRVRFAADVSVYRFAADGRLRGRRADTIG